MYSYTKSFLLVLVLFIAFFGKLSATPLPVADTTPKITVSKTTLAFGNVRLGQTVSLSFTLKNTSDTLVKLIGAVDSTLQAPFVINGGQGIFSLDSGQFVTVHVEFTPFQTGAVSDSLIITSNSAVPNDRIVLHLSGTGYIPDTLPRIGVTPTTLNFGVVYTGQSKSLQFVVSNATNTRLRLTGNVSNAHPPFAVTVGLGNFQLDSGQSFPVTVAIDPTFIGVFTDSVIINNNSENSTKRIVVKLIANIHSSDELLPAINVSADTLNFGQMTLNTGAKPILGFTIKNVSDSERLLLVNLVFPHTPFQSLGTPDHLELHRGESQDIQIQFTPQSAGVFTDSMLVISNSPKSRIAVYFKAKVIPTGSVNGPDEPRAPMLMATYPNPTKNIMLLQLTSNVSSPAIIKVNDITGKTVMTTPAQSIVAGENILPLDLSGLSEGIYQGQILGLTQPVTFKIVINK